MSSKKSYDVINLTASGSYSIGNQGATLADNSLPNYNRIQVQVLTGTIDVTYSVVGDSTVLTMQTGKTASDKDFYEMMDVDKLIVTEAVGGTASVKVTAWIE